MYILDVQNIHVFIAIYLFESNPECDDVSGGKVLSPGGCGGRGGDGTTGNGALGPGLSWPRCPLLPPETRGHELPHLPPKCGSTGHWSRGRGGVWIGPSTKFRESFHWRRPLLEHSPSWGLWDFVLWVGWGLVSCIASIKVISTLFEIYRNACVLCGIGIISGVLKIFVESFS